MPLHSGLQPLPPGGEFMAMPCKMCKLPLSQRRHEVHENVQALIRPYAPTLR